MNIRQRKRIGTIGILFGLALYSILVVLFVTSFKRLPIWAEVPVYLIFGIIWIKPCYHILMWIETSHWRLPKNE